MIPFDMCRLDGDIDNCGDGTKARVPIMQRIIETGKVMTGSVGYIDMTFPCISSN